MDWTLSPTLIHTFFEFCSLQVLPCLVIGHTLFALAYPNVICTSGIDPPNANMCEWMLLLRGPNAWHIALHLDSDASDSDHAIAAREMISSSFLEALLEGYPAVSSVDITWCPSSQQRAMFAREVLPATTLQSCLFSGLGTQEAALSGVECISMRVFGDWKLTPTEQLLNKPDMLHVCSKYAFRVEDPFEEKHSNRTCNKIFRCSVVFLLVPVSRTLREHDNEIQDP